MELRRVLVGVDGKDAANAAIRWAAKAVSEGGELIVLHATGTALISQAARSAATGLGIFPHESNERRELQRMVDQWCLPLQEAGIGYRTVISTFDPVKALIDQARKEKVDLIVIGHQGTGVLHRLVQGLSDHLIDHAKVPVVVVPS
jgi:nucleotide-binding universal stress UspA family protein